MIVTEIGIYENTTLTYYQCTTADEIKEHGRQAFWKFGSQMLYDPHEVHLKIMTSLKSGQHNIHKALSPKVLDQHHKALTAEIRKNMINALQSNINLCPPEHRQDYHNKIKSIRDMTLFNEKGMADGR
jgi:hypothetical protein